MKKSIFLCALLTVFVINVFAKNPQPTRAKTFGIEFNAGFLTSTPVGIYAHQMRSDINNRENTQAGYSGHLLPKLSAYVGILFDYRFHDKVGIGSGLVYAPKGWWLFEKRANIDQRTKNFYTVDYFEMPLFIQVYPHRLISFRVGPEISMAAISKIRKVTIQNGNSVTEKYRFGEKGSPLPAELVPGLEAALNVGNPDGLHGTFMVQYSGSVYKDSDIKPILLCLGIGYTLVPGQKHTMMESKR